MSRSGPVPGNHSGQLFLLVLRHVSQNTNYMPNIRLSEIGTVSDLGTININNAVMLTSLVPSALDLIRGCSCPKQEVWRERVIRNTSRSTQRGAENYQLGYQHRQRPTAH
jgi:hypothetical protein